MRLIAELEELIGAQASPFRAQLLREDVARLQRMRELAHTAADRAAFAVAARRLGPEAHAGLRRAWADLTRTRMEKLVGCLSTPVPRPDPE